MLIVETANCILAIQRSKQIMRILGRLRNDLEVVSPLWIKLVHSAYIYTKTMLGNNNPDWYWVKYGSDETDVVHLKSIL